MTVITKDNFQEEVLAPKVPVVLCFEIDNTDETKDCEAQKEILAAVENELKDEVKICTVNVNDQPFIALNYGVASLPSMIFMKFGLFQSRITGVVDKETIINKVSELSGDVQIETNC